LSFSFSFKSSFNHFDCSVVGGNGECYKIRFYGWSDWLDVKKRLSELCGFTKYDLKFFFGEQEMTNAEMFEDVIPVGFRKDSEFDVKVVNSFPIIVETEEKKQFKIGVNSKSRVIIGGNDVCLEMNMGEGLGEIVISGKKVKKIGRIEEMEIVEGKVILFDLCGFVDLIVKEDSRCVCLIMWMKGYVERV
jgi:hypothetical protein